MNNKPHSGPLDVGLPESSIRCNVSRDIIAWLLAVISAGLGFIAIASCGIPFVQPASTLAIILGSAGCLAAITAMIFAFLKQRSKRMLLVIAVVLLTVNGFAIWFGRLGKHLIDFLEGH